MSLAELAAGAQPCVSWDQLGQHWVPCRGLEMQLVALLVVV